MSKRPNKITIQLELDDALLLQGTLQQERSRFAEAGNEVMTDMIDRVGACLERPEQSVEEWLESEITKRFPDGGLVTAGQMRVRVAKLCFELVDRLRRVLS